MNDKIQEASRDENPGIKLEELVQQLSAQGSGRQQIYDLFLQYLSENQDSDEWVRVQDKFNGDHPVEFILDRLSGWCAQHLVLLPDEPFHRD